jgi:BirA family biotin operon repressor/biotin-[acetyl-CoA-carboxylase] ligase
VAVAEALREAGGDARITWPNDVQLDGKKVAGILTELHADTERVQFIVLGIGVNLNATAQDFGPELAAQATSLMLARQETGAARSAKVPRALFTAALLTKLEAWLTRWTAEGFAPVREAWRGLSSMLGQEVLVRSERQELRGIAEDIDESGALLLRVGARLERVLAGDVEQVRAKRA